MDSNERIYIFDLETNGLLDNVTCVHCLVIRDEKGVTHRFRHNDTENTIMDGLRELSGADLIVGHNIIGYDLPVLEKLYGWEPSGKVLDTMVCSRLIWTDIFDKDMARVRKGEFPSRLAKKHTLKAWGYRLGCLKGDFGDKHWDDDEVDNRWEHWSAEMEDYCEQDVIVTEKLYELIKSKDYSQAAIDVEHSIQAILVRQEANGFEFDKPKAWKLYECLTARKMELEKELQEIFPPWTTYTTLIPKRDNKTRGYKKGVPFHKPKVNVFNPGSRDHIADRLIKLRGWKPKDFTSEGKPVVDDEIIKALPFPEAKPIAEYLLVVKRIGQVANGKNAWLKLVNEQDNRIHGGVIHNGAVTGRMSHIRPNMAQVPRVGNPYGAECRELFKARKGWKLVGIDASGLELRMLAHYMGRYDNNQYVKVVTEGDVHSHNRDALGLDPSAKKSRDLAKRFIYAFLYGASDGKIAEIMEVKLKQGKALKDRFLKTLPALKYLKDGLANRIQNGVPIKGLDGRVLILRSPHSALNFLLQGAGAMVMKQALIILDKELRERNIPFGYCANVHDEFQIETPPEFADTVGQLGVEAIKRAGEHFGLRCPLTGEYKIGNNWKETH